MRHKWARLAGSDRRFVSGVGRPRTRIARPHFAMMPAIAPATLRQAGFVHLACPSGCHAQSHRQRTGSSRSQSENQQQQNGKTSSHPKSILHHFNFRFLPLRYHRKTRIRERFALLFELSLVSTRGSLRVSIPCSRRFTVPSFVLLTTFARCHLRFWHGGPIGRAHPRRVCSGRTRAHTHRQSQRCT